MKELLQRIRKNQRGMTMIEIVVVLTILGILAAATVPTLGGFVDDSKNKACTTTRKDIAKAYVETLTKEGYNNPGSTLSTDVLDQVIKSKEENVPSGEGSTLCQSGGTYTSVTSSDGKTLYVHCSVHGDYTVVQDATDIVSKLTAVKLTQNPLKLGYLKNGELNADGGILTLTYTDTMTGKEKTSTIDLKTTMCSGYDMSQTGDQTVKVTYAGFDAGSFNINVSEKRIMTGLSIDLAPNKVTYALGENYSLDGGRLKVTWSSGEPTYVDMTSSEVIKDDSAYISSVAGTYNISLSYGGLPAVFQLMTVTKKSVKSVKLTTPPTKTEYCYGYPGDETLDTIGGVLTITYSDDTPEKPDRETVILTKDMCTPTDMHVTTEKQTITWTYKVPDTTEHYGKDDNTGTFDVTIRQMASIAVTNVKHDVMLYDDFDLGTSPTLELSYTGSSEKKTVTLTKDMITNLTTSNGYRDFVKDRSNINKSFAVTGVYPSASDAKALPFSYEIGPMSDRIETWSNEIAKMFNDTSSKAYTYYTGNPKDRQIQRCLCNARTNSYGGNGTTISQQLTRVSTNVNYDASTGKIGTTLFKAQYYWMLYPNCTSDISTNITYYYNKANSTNSTNTIDGDTPKSATSDGFTEGFTIFWFPQGINDITPGTLYDGYICTIRKQGADFTVTDFKASKLRVYVNKAVYAIDKAGGAKTVDVTYPYMLNTLTADPSTKTYKLNDTFNINDFNFTAHYEYGDENVNASDITVVTPPDMSKVGDQPVKVKYTDARGLSAETTITVTVKKYAKTLSIYKDGAVITQDKYDQYSAFDASKYTLKIGYSDGTEETKSLSDSGVSMTYSKGALAEDALDMAKAGTDQKVNLSYTEDGTKVTADLALEIIAPTVTVENAKMTYYQGDTEDYTGQLVIKWAVNTTPTTVNLSDSGIKITGFDSTNAVDGQVLTVTYTDANSHVFTATFMINIKVKELVSIEISTQPLQISFYKGETFNCTGGQIIATYSNGKKSDPIDITTAMCSNTDTMVAPETKTITVSYTENGITKTTTYTINITKAIVVKIEMVALPTKTTYVQNNEFTAAGGTFKRIYSDSTESEAISLEYENTNHSIGNYCSQPDMVAIGKQAVTVTDPIYKLPDGSAIITTFDIIINEPSDEVSHTIIEALDNELYKSSNWWPSNTVYYYYHNWWPWILSYNYNRTYAVPLNAKSDYYDNVNTSILEPLVGLSSGAFKTSYSWAIVPNTDSNGYDPTKSSSNADAYGYTIFLYEGNAQGLNGETVNVTTFNTRTGVYGDGTLTVRKSSNTRYLDVTTYKK